MLWFNISAFGGCSFASFFLWFSLKLTKKDQLLKKWYFYLLIFLIPVLFIYLHWINNLAYIIKQPYGWTIVWPISTWTLPFYVYYLTFSIISVDLIYQFGKCSRLKYEKKQAKLIVILSVISLTIGSINVIILPLLKIFIIPSMGSIIPLIWLGGIVYAITKYKLMVLTPAYAATDILSTMSDSLILIGPGGKLLDANTATSKLLGYSREELLNQPVQILLTPREASFLQENKIQRNQQKKDIHYAEKHNNLTIIHIRR
jgi:PAS domain-containing protein